MKFLLPVLAFVTWAVPATAEVCPEPICGQECRGRTDLVFDASPLPSPTSSPTPPPTSTVAVAEAADPASTCSTGTAVYVEGIPDVIGTTHYSNGTRIKSECPVGTLCTMSPNVDEFATGESLKAAINGNMIITCHVKGYELHDLPMTMKFQITDMDTMMHGGEASGLSMEIVGEENVPTMYGMSYVVVKNGNGHKAYRFTQNGSTNYDEVVGLFGTFPGPEMHAISHVSVCVAPCEPAKVESEATPIEAYANTLQPTPSPTPIPEGATAPPVEVVQTEVLNCPPMELNNYTLPDQNAFSCGPNAYFCIVNGEKTTFGYPSDFGKTGTVTMVTCTLSCGDMAGCTSPGTSIQIEVTTTNEGYSYNLDIQDDYLITSALAKSGTGNHGFYEWVTKGKGNELIQGGTDEANIGTPIQKTDKNKYQQQQVSHLKVCVAEATTICPQK